jgi:hypothetical protein
MQVTMIPSVATLAVSTIYCLWHTYRHASLQPAGWQMRERVAYMLWVMAGHVE